MSGYDASRDQCQADAVCWCADAGCETGVCLGAQASCVLDGSFMCNYYAAPTANDCGPAGARLDGVAAVPSMQWLGACEAGSRIAIGSKAAGDACAEWHECASGLCLCANADCTARSCWDPSDCGLNLCSYRMSSTACGQLDTSVTTMPCAGSATLAGIDLGEGCVCATGTMLERGCDDGITNDWPQALSGGIPDLSPDWYDYDCHIRVGMDSIDPWSARLIERYR